MFGEGDFIKHMKLLYFIKLVALSLGFQLVLTVPVFAASLVYEPSGQEIEGVKLSSKLNGKFGDDSVSFAQVGKGLRVKKVVFVKAKVYVAELFVTDLEKFVRSANEALSSTTASKGAAVKITFLRDVDNKAFLSAFRDGWKANQYSDTDPFLQAFLEKVKAMGDQKKGSELTLVSISTSKGEKIYLNSSSGSSFDLDTKLEDRKKLFSLWLGKAADSGLEDLQKEILSGK